jgi:hypothetical protein
MTEWRKAQDLMNAATKEINHLRAQVEERKPQTETEWLESHRTGTMSLSGEFHDDTKE